MLFAPELHGQTGARSGSERAIAQAATRCARSRAAAPVHPPGSSAAASSRSAPGSRRSLTRVGPVPLRGRTDSPTWRSVHDRRHP